jgi:hypothetical protein
MTHDSIGQSLSQGTISRGNTKKQAEESECETHYHRLRAGVCMYRGIVRGESERGDGGSEVLSHVRTHLAC